MYGKGGKKGKNHAVRDPVKIAQNQEVMDELLPLVASKIDSRQGVMKVDEIAAMPDVQKMIVDIPAGFSKQLGKILLHHSDFFVNLPNGMVGTAKGYECGLINEDGTLDASFNPEKNGKSLTSAKAASKAPPLASTDKKALTDAVNQMWTAGMNLDDETALYMAFSNLQAVRSDLKRKRPAGTAMKTAQHGMSKGKGKAAVAEPNADAGQNQMQPQLNLSAIERQQRRQAVMDRCVEKLQENIDQTLLLTQLVVDEVIKENKKGAIPKFLHFFQEFPSVFSVEAVEGTPQHKISLVSVADAVVPLKPNKRPRTAC